MTNEVAAPAAELVEARGIWWTLDGAGLRIHCVGKPVGSVKNARQAS